MVALAAWSFVHEWWFVYLALPALIFCARVGDVSLDTMRIIFVNRGRKVLAPLLGFLEVLIWLAAVAQVMKNLSNPVCYLAYGGGFACGNLVGMLIEEKLAVGLLAMRIIVQKDASALVAALRAQGYGVTNLDGHGADGPVNVLFVVIRRRHFAKIVEQVALHAPDAFYSVEEVRSVGGGTMAAYRPGWRPQAFIPWGTPDER